MYKHYNPTTYKKILTVLPEMSSISRAGLEVNVNVTIISRADMDVHACLLSDIFSEYMWTA